LATLIDFLISDEAKSFASAISCSSALTSNSNTPDGSIVFSNDDNFIPISGGFGGGAVLVLVEGALLPSAVAVALSLVVLGAMLEEVLDKIPSAPVGSGVGFGSGFFFGGATAFVVGAAVEGCSCSCSCSCPCPCPCGAAGIRAAADEEAVAEVGPGVEPKLDPGIVDVFADAGAGATGIDIG